jgi:hypothetical protein
LVLGFRLFARHEAVDLLPDSLKLGLFDDGLAELPRLLQDDRLLIIHFCFPIMRAGRRSVTEKVSVLIQHKNGRIATTDSIEAIEAPRTKLQSSREAPNPKPQCRRDSCLWPCQSRAHFDPERILELGAWSFHGSIEISGFDSWSSSVKYREIVCQNQLLAKLPKGDKSQP